jgi:hypothetical protein
MKMVLEKEARGKWMIELERPIYEGQHVDRIELMGVPAEDIRWLSLDQGSVKDPATGEIFMLLEAGCFLAKKPFALLQDWWPVEASPPRLYLSGRRSRPYAKPQTPYIRHPKYERGILGWRWAGLSALASFWGKDTKALWQEYFYLAGTNGCAKYLKVTTDPKKESKLAEATVHSTINHSWWVPAGWAHNVCVMCYFGFSPPNELLEIIKARCA